MSHLSRETLKGFAVGSLSEAQTRAVESHLESCEACGLRLDELDISDDGLIGLLRNSPTQTAGCSSWAKKAPRCWPGEHRHQPQLEHSSGIGERLGRYTIESQLGRGGMGTVYRAFDEVLRRSLAIKIVSPQRSLRAEDLFRFRREAESAARLQHANIVQIFDFGEDQGVWYCAFELVEGGTFSERLARGGVPLKEAATTIATLADAVQYAHERGVIHRDLKPDNVLFTPNGTPKIADFGLAKLLDEDVAATRDGTMIGSPCYMSPEQADGKNQAMGPATDVYGLGALLYEAITGRPPFEETTVAATIERVRKTPPLRPSRIRDDADIDLDTICQRCLEKNPSDRYGSASDLADDLRRYAAGMPIKARPPGLWEQVGKLCRRHPVESGGIAAFALTVTALLAGMTVQAYFLSESLDNTAKALTESTRQLDRANRNVYSQQLLRAAVVSDYDPSRAFQLLQDSEKCPASLKDFCWRFLRTASKRRLAKWTIDTPTTATAASPDNRLFVVGDASGRLHIFHNAQSSAGPANGNAATVVSAHPGETITAVTFSAEGNFLVSCGNDGVVRRWDLLDSPGVKVVEGVSYCCDCDPDTSVNSAALSPNGKTLATAHSDHKIRVWNADTAELIETLVAHEDSVFAVAFNCDGSRLASGSRDGSLRIWNTSDWKRGPDVHHHQAEITSVVFSPVEKDLVAWAGNDRSVCLWNVATSFEPMEWSGFESVVSSLSFSRDGQLIAAGSYDQSFQVRRVADAEIVFARNVLTASVEALDFNSTNSLLTVLRNGNVSAWSVEPRDSGRSVRKAFRRSVTGLQFVDNNLVVSHFDGLACIDLANKELVEEEVWAQGANRIAVASSADMLAWEKNGRIHIGTAKAADAQRVALEASPIGVNALSLSPNGRLLVVADSYGLAAFRSATGERIWNWDGQRDVQTLTQNRAGTMLAIACDQQVLLGDPATGTIRLMSQLEQPCEALAFSFDGKRLAAGMSNGDVVVFDVQSWKELARLTGYRQRIADLIFSPDGKTLATASRDGVRLWDPVVGAERLRLAENRDVRAIAFDSASRRLACGDRNGNVTVWDTSASIAGSHGSR